MSSGKAFEVGLGCCGVIKREVSLGICFDSQRRGDTRSRQNNVQYFGLNQADISLLDQSRSTGCYSGRPNR